jgi:hypothetical protein
MPSFTPHKPVVYPHYQITKAQLKAFYFKQGINIRGGADAPAISADMEKAIKAAYTDLCLDKDHPWRVEWLRKKRTLEQLNKQLEAQTTVDNFWVHDTGHIKIELLHTPADDRALKVDIYLCSPHGNGINVLVTRRDGNSNAPASGTGGGRAHLSPHVTIAAPGTHYNCGRNLSGKEAWEAIKEVLCKDTSLQGIHFNFGQRRQSYTGTDVNIIKQAIDALPWKGVHSKRFNRDDVIKSMGNQSQVFMVDVLSGNSITVVSWPEMKHPTTLPAYQSESPISPAGIIEGVILEDTLVVTEVL